MTNAADYIAVEADYFKDWPESPTVRFQDQLTRIADELKENVRNWALNQRIDIDDYWEHASLAREWLESVRNALTVANQLNPEQREKFHPQYFWLHQDSYQGGLLGKGKAVWPIDREMLREGVEQYLSRPQYWSEALDYALTDALVYAEVAAFRESIDISDYFQASSGFGPNSLPALFGSLLKWALALGLLYVARLFGPDFFVVGALFMVAFYLGGKLTRSPYPRSHTLLAQMIRGYHACAPTQYSVTSVLRSCLDLHASGVGFDGVLYDLLEKQSIQNRKRWV